MTCSVLRQLIYLSASLIAITTVSGVRADELARGSNPEEHPLMPAIRMAKAGLDHIDGDIKDYTCTLVKRERIQGEIVGPQFIYCKVRHEPFSCYLYFLKPDDISGREVIFIEGQNNGKLLAHEAKGVKAKFGKVALKPESTFAMEGQRYPITLLGIRTLTQRLIEQGERDLQYGECEVKFIKGAKINGRVCTCIQSVHPQPRKQFRYHLARIFVDDELQVPIRYAAYMWPGKKGGKPALDEEYTYMNLKLNVGLTDEDFDYRNNEYRFVRAGKRNK